MSNVVAIAGSPSHPSRTYAVLEYTKQLLDREQVSTQLISVRDLNPEALLFAQFDHSDVKSVTTAVESADALIVSTPVYKAAYTGVLKALLDLLPQNALANKVVLPIATGGTIAHFLSLDYALKPVLATLGARTILAGVYVLDTQLQKQEDGSYQFVDSEVEHQFVDSEVEQRLQNSVSELATAIRPERATVGAVV